jgi:uncharacterized protein YecA (UPF0149 family)
MTDKEKNNMPRMMKFQLDHFRSKTNRTYDPLIEEQELLVKQFTTEATNKASKKLAVKIGAQKIIDALKNAEEMVSKAQKSAQSFFEKKATTKEKKENLSSKFEKDSYRYDDDKITLEDCEEQIRTWAKALADQEIKRRPEGRQLAKLEIAKQDELDTIMESEAPAALIEKLEQKRQKVIGISWNTEPKAIEQQ